MALIAVPLAAVGVAPAGAAAPIVVDSTSDSGTGWRRAAIATAAANAGPDTITVKAGIVIGLLALLAGGALLLASRRRSHA